MYDLLKGLIVVEAAAFIAGPTCGLYLGQFGAEVIRIDQIGGGPDFRRWPLAANGESLYWEGLNKAKKSVVIDLARPEGRELAQRLATAPGDDRGMFVTNFPAEGFLSYERLKALRDDVICVRVMGWGDGRTALDYTINASIGLPAMTGHPDDPRPVNHVLPAWDLLTGAYAAFSMVSAERARRAGKGGCEVRVPLSDIAATALANMGYLAEALVGEGARPRLGNDVFGAFGRDYELKDGRRVMLVAITPRQWRGTVKALGLDDAVAGLEAELGVSLAASESVRYQHRARLHPLFEAAFAGRTEAELAPSFEEGGVCWSAYRTMAEAAQDTTLFGAGNPVFGAASQPSGLDYPVAGPAATLAGQPRGAPAPAPRLGANTDEVLAELLGMSSSEIGRLHDAGLVKGSGMSDDYSDWIGRSRQLTAVLEPEIARRYAAAMGASLDVEGSFPPLGHWAYFNDAVAPSDLGPDGHQRRGLFVPPIALPRRMFASSTLRFEAPLALGETAEFGVTVADIRRRSGRSGDLVLMDVLRELTQGGRLRIHETQTIVFRDAGDPTPPVVDTGAGGEGELWTPGPVDLFRYSAGTYNSHRIHYDRPYATSEEGYPDLVVHGPFTAAKLFDLATRHAGAPLKTFGFRAMSPLFVNQPIRLRAGDEPNSVVAVRCDGAVAMSATYER